MFVCFSLKERIQVFVCVKQNKTALFFYFSRPRTTLLSFLKVQCFHDTPKSVSNLRKQYFPSSLRRTQVFTSCVLSCGPFLSYLRLVYRLDLIFFSLPLTCSTRERRVAKTSTLVFLVQPHRCHYFHLSFPFSVFATSVTTP